MLNAWILWWNTEALTSGLAGYWNAPIYFPAPGALALNEPQPAFLLLAPIHRFMGSPVPVYNLYLLVTLALNGWCTTRFLRQIKTSWLLAFAGGVAMLLHPLLWRNLEAIQLTVLWPIIASISAALKLLSTHNENRASITSSKTSFRFLPALWLGFCFAVTGWTCLYWFLFSLLTLGPTLFLFAVIRRSRNDALHLAVAACVCFVLMLPLYLPMRHYANEYQLSRSPELVQALSAEPADWIATAGHSLWNPAAAENNLALSPGLGKVLLCVAGVLVFFACWRDTNPTQRQTAVLLLGILTLSFVLSFGSNLAIGSWNLWEAFSAVINVLRSVRSPFRFAYLVQLATVLLAAISADFLLQIIHQKIRAHTGMLRIVVSLSVAIVFASVMIFDSIPERTLVCFPPSAKHPEPWRSFVTANVPSGDGILCLPVAVDNTEAGLERAARWMMHATAHGVPLANGYSGFAPSDWRKLRRELRRGEYNTSLLGSLASKRIRHLVVRTDQLPREHLQRLQALENVEVVYEDQRYKIFHIAN